MNFNGKSIVRYSDSTHFVRYETRKLCHFQWEWNWLDESHHCSELVIRFSARLWSNELLYLVSVLFQFGFVFRKMYTSYAFNVNKLEAFNVRRWFISSKIHTIVCLLAGATECNSSLFCIYIISIDVWELAINWSHEIALMWGEKLCCYLCIVLMNFVFQMRSNQYLNNREWW